MLLLKEVRLFRKSSLLLPLFVRLCFLGHLPSFSASSGRIPGDVGKSSLFFDDVRDKETGVQAGETVRDTGLELGLEGFLEGFLEGTRETALDGCLDVVRDIELIGKIDIVGANWYSSVDFVSFSFSDAASCCSCCSCCSCFTFCCCLAAANLAALL